MLETERVGILSLKSLPPHSTYSTGIPLHLSVQVLCSMPQLFLSPFLIGVLVFSFLIDPTSWRAGPDSIFFCSHSFIHTTQGKSPLGAKHGTAELVDVASVLRRQTVLSGGLLPKNKGSCILTGRHARHRNKPCDTVRQTVDLLKGRK